MGRLFLLLIPIALIGAPPTVQVVRLSGGYTQLVLPLQDGSTLAVGTASDFPPQGAVNSGNTRRAISLMRVTSSGMGTALPVGGQFGHGNDIPQAATLDRSGNIWLAGTTDSDDFPLVNAFIAQKMPYRAIGFVTKLDPNGAKILFSTFLGGHQLSIFGFSRVTNLTSDSAGNVYVLGYTSESDFPQTSPILGSGAPRIDGFSGSAVYTFIVKLSPNGQLLCSVLLGGDKFNCSGGSSCLGKEAQTIGSAISVDANGIVTIAGSTNATNLPTTAHAFQPTCLCSQLSDAGFVARVDPSSGSLIWATYLGVASLPAFFTPASMIQGMALDAKGNVYVAGTAYDGFPTTPGVIQPVISAHGTDVNYQVYVSKLSADGSSLLYSTYLGGTTGSQFSGLVLDAAGNLWIGGSSSAPDFPSSTNTTLLGNDFVAELNADASAFLQLYRLPTGTLTQPPVFDANGTLLLLASQGTLVRLSPVSGLAGTGVIGFGNAASQTLNIGISPGELVTIYGVGLGPAVGIAAVPDASGHYPTQLGGTQVMIGSTAASLLFVGPNQINLQVPFQAYPNTIRVTAEGNTLEPIQIIQKPSLGIFHRDNGFAAALNQDGSVNSPSNPAIPGSIVSLFATGLEQSLVLTDGTLWPGPNPFSLQFLDVVVTTSLGPGSLEISYAGAAPGLINGVSQINVRLPLELTNPRLTLGATLLTHTSSNAVQIYTH